jgi:MFS family permease
MDSLGGGLWMVGLFYGLSALAEMPGMYYNAALRSRFGGPGALLFAYFLTAAGVVGQALAASPWVLLASTSLRGAGFGLFFAVTVRLIDERVPEEWSSTTQAIMQAGAWGLIPLIAAPLSGLVYDLAGGPALFWSGAVLVGLAILVILLASARGLFSSSPKISQ